MKRVRRTLLMAGIVSAIISIILLLNFTAPNPTGRRYSTATPPLRGENRNGYAAEDILAEDLGIPHNQTSEQTQCVCNPSLTTSNPSSGGCTVCSAYSEVVTQQNLYIPDFVTTNFIAEAKNYAPASPFLDRVEQITAFAEMARFLGRPFWLFVAVDTNVPPEMFSIVESTGGGVIYYFTIEGYVDPVDSAANSVLVLSGVLIGITGVAEIFSHKRIGRRVLVDKPSSTPPPPKDPLNRAERKTDMATDFAQRSKDRLRQSMDIEDARNNLLD